MNFLSRAQVRPWFEGKTVAIVGSGPGVLENPAGLIDSFSVVCRINNYRIVPPATGTRCTVFYSFFGTSIRKTVDELKRDGVTLCMSKTPNAHAIQSEWHRRNNKMIGVDYRPHFVRRKDWWFTATYAPTVDEFLEKFDLLGQHQPTTGFSAILDVLSFGPKSLHLTGFDGFTSGLHNVSDVWDRKEKNLDDPHRHEPLVELAWLRDNLPRFSFPVTTDRMMELAMRAAP